MRINDRDAVAEVFGEETVVVNLDTGRYYALDAPATAIWERLAAGSDFEQIAASLAHAHSVDIAAARPVTGRFLRVLIEEKLVIGDIAAFEFAEVDSSEIPTPGIEIFTDMSELLAADPIHDIDLDGTGWPQAPERITG